MSNKFNDKFFEEIMEQVEQDDRDGLLEEEIFTFTLTISKYL